MILSKGISVIDLEGSLNGHQMDIEKGQKKKNHPQNVSDSHNH